VNRTERLHGELDEAWLAATREETMANLKRRKVGEVAGIPVVEDESVPEGTVVLAEVETATAREELTELAELYLEADIKEKAAKQQKELLRGPIMELISEVVRDEVPLATKVVPADKAEVDDVYGGDVRAWLAMHHPEWTLLNATTDGETFTLEIQENDSLVKFEFAVGDYKFGRTTSTSAPTIDAGALREDEQFQALGAEDVVVEHTIYELDEKAATRFMVANPESATVFARHTTPGKVSARLLPFSQLKEDA